MSKPKNNNGDPSRDHCQTPDYALEPLVPYLNALKAHNGGNLTVWEPAAGEGLLADALYDGGIETVIQGDVTEGQNFFDYEPEEWDCIVTNPPFSGKYRWLERCYSLQKPFALLLPLETLGAKTAQELIREHGISLILFNQRIDYKMPNNGWGGSAQFPSAWFVWGFDLPQQLIFADITTAKDRFVAGLGD